jgi:subtilisin family serine protease
MSPLPGRLLVVGVALFCLTWFAPCPSPLAAEPGESGTSTSVPTCPAGRLESALLELHHAYHERGPEDALALAEALGLETDGLMVNVSVDQTWGETTDVVDLDRIREIGGIVLGLSERFLEVSIPFDRLAELCECDGVAFVQRIIRGAPGDWPEGLARETISEGVGWTKAADWHAQGHKGAGVDVAIIDGGFAGIDAAVASGDLPPEDDMTFANFSSEAMDEGSSHGTRVAEAVHDMAPDATLWLVKATTRSELQTAALFCGANDPTIINHSYGWYRQQVDGDGEVARMVDQLHDDYDVLWVNSMGNQACNHYMGEFNDNGSGWHLFAADDRNLSFRLAANEKITLDLTWDGWPTTQDDYDLRLYYDVGAYAVRKCTTRQYPSGAPPVETITYTAPAHMEGEYHVRVRKHHATSDHTLHLHIRSGWPVNKFHPEGNGEYCEKSGSLLTPADAEHALAVAAITQERYTTGPQSYYSSQGPTDDERIKPEIAAPDSCSTSGGVFTGTSQASPHVAGAAALVQSRWNMGADQTRQWLIQNATKYMSDRNQNNVYGHGRLELPSPTPVEGSVYATLSETGAVTVRWTTNNLPGVTGFNVYRSVEAEGPFIRINGSPIPTGAPAEYIDETVWPGSTFWYEVRALLPSGSEETVGPMVARVTTGGTLVAALHRPMPNPFVDRTTVVFDVPDEARAVSVCVYDARGRLVAELAGGPIGRGRHTVTWDGSDATGRPVASGVYFARLQVDGRAKTGKIVLAR